MIPNILQQMRCTCAVYFCSNWKVNIQTWYLKIHVSNQWSDTVFTLSLTAMLEWTVPLSMCWWEVTQASQVKVSRYTEHKYHIWYKSWGNPRDGRVPVWNRPVLGYLLSPLTTERRRYAIIWPLTATNTKEIFASQVWGWVCGIAFLLLILATTSAPLYISED